MTRFPRPSSGSNVFAFCNGPGTRSTTYADKTLFVQSILRHIIVVDIFLDLFQSPFQQWVEFDDVEMRIVFKKC